MQPKPRNWSSRASFVVVGLILLGMSILFVPAVLHTRSASRRQECKNNLTTIGLALHNYHEQYGCFPPAYVADEDGRPMHSWRVLLLPFLAHGTLYNEYRFDEPWDGPNNRKLADRLVNAYSCPAEGARSGRPESFHTSYVAVVGPGTAWPGETSIRRDDIKDAIEGTIHLVEISNSGIHWMEPRDLPLGKMAPTINAGTGPGISSRHPGGAHILVCDEIVRFVPDKFDADRPAAKLIRHYLEISDGVPLRDEF